MVLSSFIPPISEKDEPRARLYFNEWDYTVKKGESQLMAGHSTTHPYLKSYDELKRTYNRLDNYKNMYRDTIPNDEIYKIQEILELIDEAVTRIPEKFHVSRWQQFKK